MEMMVRRRRFTLAFGFALTLIYAVALSITRSLPGLDHGDILSAAVALDLTMTAPALYYLLMVRGAGLRPISVVPVFLLSLAIAHFVIPEAHQDSLSWISRLAIPLEIGLSAYIVTATVRSIRLARRDSHARDVLSQLRESCAHLIPSRRIAEIVAHELAALYYALFSPLRQPEIGPSSFSYHKKSSYGSLLVGLILIATLEIGVVHLLLLQWKPFVAWVVFAISVYSMLWLVGDYRAMRLRPVVIERSSLRIRLGLRWDLLVPFDSIAGISHPAKSATDRRAILRAVPFGDPNLLLSLKSPQTAIGVFGFRRSVLEVEMAIDEAARFESQLKAALGPTDA